MPSPSSPEQPVVPLLVEALEPRIAPASLIDAAVPNSIVAVTVGTPQLLIANQAGQPSTLATSNVGGSYLVNVSQGAALVFTTDVNGDGQFDSNEITGVALSDGARLTLFTNVNGDIATNLEPTGSGSFQLTDSDNDVANGRDGLRLTAANVQNITLRSVTTADLNTTVPGETAANRLALSGYSIFGNIYVGGDFGVPGSGANNTGAVPGLLFDPSGAALQAARFTGNTGDSFFPGLSTPPSVGSIKTGTATSFSHLSFGNSFGAGDITGELTGFTQAPGTDGSDITGIRSAGNAPFAINVLAAGDGGTGVGGAGARGGNITDVTLNGESGGYQLIAGDGGAGVTGGVGGSVTGFNDLGSITSLALIHSGDGGRGNLLGGGAAGVVNLGTVATVANLRVILGDGGDGLSTGGAGASQPLATIAPPDADVSLGQTVLSTTRDSYTFISALTGLPTTNPQPGDTLATVLDPTTGQRVALHAYDIGATRSVDFDGDGFSDALYTSSAPDQVVLVFGKSPFTAPSNPNDAPAQAGQVSGTTIDPSKTIFLDASVNPQGVVIADFNADGRPDVAVASADPGSFGGVRVFLNQITDPNRNPTNVPAFTGSPLGDRPFSDALHSTLPVLTDLATADRVFLQSPVAIRNLVSGDFNGDGVMDLAFLGVYRNRLVEGVGSEGVVTVLFGDTDPNHAFGNGYFYANAALPTDAPASRVQFIRVQDTANEDQRPQLIATSLVSDLTTASLRSNQPVPLNTFNVGQHDSLFVAVPETADLREFAVSFNAGAATAGAVPRQPLFQGLSNDFTPSLGLPAGFVRGLGQVDTDRGGMVALEDATFADFTVLDFNNDGRADIVSITQDPAQFLVTFTGSGGLTSPFALTFASNVNGAGNNAGIRLATANSGRALAPTDVPLAGGVSPIGLAIFTLRVNDTTSVRERAFVLTPAPNNFFGLSTAAAGDPPPDSGEVTDDVLLAARGADRGIISFDLYRSLSGEALGTTGYEALSPSQGNRLRDFVDFSFRGGLPGGALVNLTANGVEARAGDGGDALSGNGGRGGLIGGALSPSTATPTGSVTVVIPGSAAYEGTLTLRGGNGGNGFTGAGEGGDVTGTVVRYAGGATVLSSDAQIIAGTGGFSTGGTGGRGGDIAQVSIASGTRFQAGNGGGGLNGARGGNITGNTAGLFDSQSSVVQTFAGDGGLGRVNGGVGGSVTNFRAQFLNIIGGTGGLLNYVAGDGGAGGAGTGGAGGDLLNNSPDRGLNALAGSISLTAGAGGDGLTGGRGGNVDTFVNAPTQAALPTDATVLAGNGGVGITARGGLGGSVRGVNVAATGFVGSVDFRLVNLNKAIAGNGGASFGLDGGAGGTLTANTLTSVSQPFAAASGAGGDGLLSGGNGGLISNNTFDSAGSPGRLGKVLVIAGAGGDASSVAPADVNLPGDPVLPGRALSLTRLTLALGGESGVGGNGGSITGFTQPASVQVNVDLIAGNGGSIRYGSPIVATGNVGRGGSITGVSVAGEIGASLGETVSNVSPPIRSYTDVTGDRTEDQDLAQFVANTLRPLNNTLLLSFNDGSVVTPAGTSTAVGNVGIVAGIAGRVGAVNGTVGQPAVGVPNGAVTNVTARNIMSIVAGSVDSVAPVDNVANIRVTSGERILPADKSPLNPSLPGFNPLGRANGGVPEYLDLTGRVVNDLQPGYRLIDGAVYAFANTTGDLQINPRIIILPQG